MKRLVLFPLVALSLAYGSVASAQSLPLPALSPHAAVSQTVGITEVTIDYSSPGLKGRKVFGTLVPFGELWRAGANAATKITFAHDVLVGEKPVAAGTYSLFFIPTAKTWTVVLNTNKDASTTAYDQKLDAVRLEVKPEKSPKRERMLFLFANTTDESTRVDLEWDELRVSFPVKVDTAKIAAAAIQAHVDAAWRPLAQAARYYSDVAKDQDKALALVDASMAVKVTWYNSWIKALVLAAGGNYKDAYPFAEKAYELGKNEEGFFFKADIEKALAEWKVKL